MRFHIGISKRIRPKVLIKFAIGLFILLTYAFSTYNAKAYIDNNPTAVKQCPYNTLFTNSNCTSLSPVHALSSQYGEISSYTSNTTNSALNSRSINYQYLGNTSGNCNTSQQVSFYVDVYLDQYISQNTEPPFNPGALNPNNWTNPTTRGALTRSTTYAYNNYYDYLRSGTTSSDNTTGVKLFSYSNSTGYTNTACSFISYGSNLSVRFFCQERAKQEQYWVNMNVYNNNGANSSIGYARTSIKISNVNDPCSSSSGSGGSGEVDMSGVISQIQDATNQIISNNNFTSSEIIDSTHSDLQDIKQQNNSIKEGINQIDQDLYNCSVKEIQANNSSTHWENSTSNKNLASNGGLVNENNFAVTPYIVIGSRYNRIQINYTNNGYYCLYTRDKLISQCFSYDQEFFTNRQGLSTYDEYNWYYVRFSYSIDSTSYQIPKTTLFSRCQSISENLFSGELEFGGGSGAGHYFDSLGEIQETPVSSLILLPINILQKLVDTLDESICEDYILPFGLTGGEEVIRFPCINFGASTLLGSDLWNIIDIFFCVFMFYKIAMMCIKFFDNWTRLKSKFDNLYY